MKYLIDISQRQSQKIQEYLDKGEYLSVSQFVITAIENQFNLEDNQSLPDVLKTENSNSKSHHISNPLQLTRVLELYRISDMHNFYSVIAPPRFDQIVLSSQNIDEEKIWLWGQINKIFPVKIAVRILQKNLGDKQSIELNEFLETATKEASEIGNTIRAYEKKQNKNRGEKISAGLPGQGDEKSQSRYKFQFLVYQRKDDLLDGAMSILRFCNLERKNGKIYIGLTEGGAKFSAAINPVFDEGNLDESLSDEEIECYLNHVEKYVRSEFVAINWMLQKIGEGINERGLLNQKINEEFGNVWNTSEAVINTQRSGLIARMFELKLIEKEKNGIYVTYSLSEKAKRFMLSN